MKRTSELIKVRRSRFSTQLEGIKVVNAKQDGCMDKRLD